MTSFMREKKIFCGKKYMEVDLIPRTSNGDRAVKGKRSKKIKESEPKQKNLNDKNSKRYAVQLVNGNFGKGDLHVTLTYSWLPIDEEEAKEYANKQIANYFRRINNRRKKEGLEALKYFLVTEYSFPRKDGEKRIRIHHHVVMNGGLNRDEVENLWSKKSKTTKVREPIGYVNADRLQPNENGVEALCKYMMKSPQGKKRWSSSRNLVRPCSRANDNKYSKRKVERLAKDPNSKEKFEKIYPAYNIVGIKAKYHDDTGWHIYMKMWKKKE